MFVSTCEFWYRVRVHMSNTFFKLDTCWDSLHRQKRDLFNASNCFVIEFVRGHIAFHQ